MFKVNGENKTLYQKNQSLQRANEKLFINKVKHLETKMVSV
jgi:hypothetical protein